MTFLSIFLLQLAPAELPLPKEADPAKPWALVRTADGARISAQVSEGKIVFLDRGQGDPYRLVPEVPALVHPWTLKDEADGSFELCLGGRAAARYVAKPLPPPAGLDPVYTRGGFLHPLYSPAGTPLTNASPKHHAHHYGVWSGWKRVAIDGVEGDLWLPTAHTGAVEAEGVEAREGGPVFAGFRARHRLTIRGRPAIEERWEVREYLVEGRYVLDLRTRQEAQGDLTFQEFRYGGIGFRGPLDWEGKDGMTVLTSDRKTRDAAQGSRPNWILLSGKGGSVGLIGHNGNFRAPEPLRVHPDEPFFNWALPADGDFSLTKGLALDLRYRFVLSDDPIPPEFMDALALAFSRPTAPRLVP